MTNVVVNNLNNMEEMLSNSLNWQKTAQKNSAGMDKSADFDAIFDKSIDKEHNKVLKENQESFITDTKTIKDAKDAFSQNASDKSVDWLNFKNILKEITDEANVETSLDLTLARDINEIISQLKNAIESVSEIIDGEDVATSDLANVVEELMVEFNNAENGLDLESKAELKEAFKNILAIIDNLINKTQFDLNKTSLENIAKNLEATDSIELSQNEVIEFAEDIIDEVKTITGKIVQEEPEANIQEINIDEEIVKELKIEAISVDADMNNGENLMQRQAPEEYAVKAMINDGAEVFDVKIEPAQNIQNNQNVQFRQVDSNPSRILEQITKHFEGLQNNSKVNIVLNPEALGKVNIQLLTAKDGLTAQFTVTTQEARDLLMKGLDGLKESLLSHGVAVDNVSVKVADAQKAQYDQDWTEQEGSRGGNKEQGRSNKDEDEKGLFEKMMANITDEENGNV